jgi:hypothetical protein
MLDFARAQGHAGATGQETADNTLSLVDVYQAMRAGSLDMANADGKWAFGLALIKASAAL